MTDTKTSPLADIAPYPLVEADATAERTPAREPDVAPALRNRKDPPK